MQEKRGIPSWVTIGFGLLTVALVVILIYRSHQANVQIQKDGETITLHSNNWVKANADLQDTRQANLNLENQLTESKTEITNLNTTLAQKEAKLTETETALVDVQAALKSAKDEVAKRDSRIAELESQNQTLERQTMDLTSALASLNLQIEDTKNKLTASEGDKAALEKELKRLMAEKAELERKFNDLSALKAQVKKVKTELVTAKRLDWLRSGIQTSEPKGAEKMTSSGAARKKNYNLNVEVNSDGTTKVIPPIINKPDATRDAQPIEMK